MATYRKQLIDKDGNYIIPIINDTPGKIYQATVASSTSTATTYNFSPDTPLEQNRVYNIQFPLHSTNLNSTALLTDGNITPSSILIPPTDTIRLPSYTLATPNLINESEPWALVFNGTQWITLNQKFTTTGVAVNPNFAVSGGSYTASRPGQLFIQTAVAGGANVTISINGTQIARTQSSSSAFVWIPFSCQLNLGDTVAVTTSDNGGNAQVVPSLCRFFGFA